MPSKPKSIDDVLSRLSADKRATLQKLRKAIQAAAPKAEECISYQLPAFRLDGKFLAAFGAATKHCAFYPASYAIEKLKQDLAKYDTSKGAIRFPIDKPLPSGLVKKLIKARMEQMSNHKTESPKSGHANRVPEVISALKRLATKTTRDGMARYVIPSEHAFGVAVGDIRGLAKKLGRNHELAAKLWKTGWYEARMLVAFVDEPAQVTPAQMDRWCRDFDNWAICDTLCFHLFDRTPHAFKKVSQWCKRKEEFVRRAGFALLASLALHDKKAPDQAFIACLPAIEAGAHDGRNFVKKAVSWALRGIGKRNDALKSRALAVAERLAASDNSSCRWVGKDALRDLSRPKKSKAS